MTVIGIDPGASGAIVTITETRQVFAIKMPNTYIGILNSIKNIKEGRENLIAYIERVGSFPSDKEDDRFMRMDALIKNQAAFIMALISEAVPFVVVSPVTWQKHHGLQNKKNEKLSYQLKKNRNRDLAEKYYPGINKYAADALLIAVFGLENSQSDLFILDKAENYRNTYPQKQQKTWSKKSKV
jgi:hypothetical protein